MGARPVVTFSACRFGTRLASSPRLCSPGRALLERRPGRRVYAELGTDGVAGGGGVARPRRLRPPGARGGGRGRSGGPEGSDAWRVGQLPRSTSRRRGSGGRLAEEL